MESVSKFKDEMELIFFLKDEKLKLERKTSGSVGYDIKSNEEFVLDPGQYRLIKTGVKAIIPDGVFLDVRPRSGLAAKHGITVLNTPGTIDSDYRGEIGVILINHSKEPFKIEKYMRIAQIVPMRSVFCDSIENNITVYFVTCENDEEFNNIGMDEENNERKQGGFGSTGF